jgi:T4-like virus Myoviridae tail sheath stabiliser
MFGQQFYHGTTRKYIVLFGTIFNDIVITREDAEGNTVDSIKVPLTYAPKDKMLARVMQDPNLDKETAITLPRMSFEYKAPMYDGDRKLNTLNWTARKDDTDANKFMRMYEPVPMNFKFYLYVYVKNAEDGTKITEQIQPWFRPDWTAHINLIPELDISMKIPLILDSCTSEDHYDAGYLTRRALIWTLEFTLKGYLFGPIKKVPIIKFANTRFFTGTPEDSSDVVSMTTVTPGMFANGMPTSNAELSISPRLIEVDDDWDYAIQQSGLIITEE